MKLRVEKVGQPAPAAKVSPVTTGRPGDTAVPLATVTPGAASDEFEIDFDDEPDSASEEEDRRGQAPGQTDAPRPPDSPIQPPTCPPRMSQSPTTP